MSLKLSFFRTFTESLPIPFLMQDEMKLLARLAMIQSDRDDALKALKRLWTEPGWQTLLGIVQSAREGPSHPLPFSPSPKALTTDR